MTISIYEPMDIHRTKLTEMITLFSIQTNVDVKTMHIASLNQISLLEADTNLLIMDVDILNRLIEIDICHTLRNQGSNIDIILMSAHIEIAKEGYLVNAFRFLLKPVTQQEINIVLSDYVNMCKFSNKNRLAILCANGCQQFFHVNDILYIDSFNRKRYIHTPIADNETWTSLTDIESILNDSIFVRVHRSYIVNIYKIDKIHQLRITMINGDEVRLSRRYYSLLQASITKSNIRLPSSNDVKERDDNYEHITH